MNNSEATIRFSYGVKVQQALRYAGVYEPSTVKKLTSCINKPIRCRLIPK